MTPDGAVCLYRHWGSSGELLYVGISSTPFARFRSHEREHSWAFDVVTSTYSWYPDRSTAERAERDAIVRENPIHNTLRYKPTPTAAELRAASEKLRADGETRWITIDQAAATLCVSRDMIRRMVGRGELPGKRFGKKLIRIDADQLDAAGATLTAKEEAA